MRRNLLLVLSGRSPPISAWISSIGSDCEGLPGTIQVSQFSRSWLIWTSAGRNIQRMWLKVMSLFYGQKSNV